MLICYAALRFRYKRMSLWDLTKLTIGEFAMRKVVVAGTTHLDSHNTIISKEALERAADDINNSKKPVLTIEHDTTLPPIGQIVKALVEPTEDGEYKLLTEQEIF